MKRIVYHISAALMALMVLASCNDWLAAVSNTEIQDADLFSQKDGFTDALTGVYILMGSESLYGRNLSWFCPDLMTYPVNTSDSYVMSQWQNKELNEKYPKADIYNSWLAAYNVIANINKIIEEMSAHKELFTNKTEYNLLRGELFGLRAYIHFDLMRFFGLPASAEGYADKLAIPYVTRYSKEVTPQLTYAETNKLLLEDLAEALYCLKEDPITGVVDEAFQNAANSEGYWNNRQKHFNYYAAVGLAARIHMWLGNTDKAAEYAQQVIDEAFSSHAVQWFDYSTNLNESGKSTKRDWTMSKEHLFSLEITELYSKAGILYSSSSDIGFKLNLFMVDEFLYPVEMSYYDDTDPENPVLIYESLAGAEDVRGPLMQLDFTTNGYNSYKLYGSSASSETFRNRMPLIRISEMYYILAECGLRKLNFSKLLANLNEVRRHRGIQDDFELSMGLDPLRELSMEYAREFYNEGQYFHYVKRMGPDVALSWQGIFSSSQYKDLKGDPSLLVFPFPEDEINYGRVQDRS